MIKIGDQVVSKNHGVCTLVGIENKDFGTGSFEYFVLKPYYSKSENSLYYVRSDLNNPIRKLISKDEALSLIDSFDSYERLWDNNPKTRHQKFSEIYKSGELSKLCQLVKSLLLQNEELKLSKKSLSIVDREYLDKIRTNIHNEFALVLDLDPTQVQSFIYEKIGFKN